MRALAPNLNVSLFYPHIFDEPLLSVPSQGSINVHPGLLPHYRGCNSIEWAIMHNEKEVGVTSLNIYNRIRAFAHPNPGCLALLGGKRLIVWRATYDPAWPVSDETPGRVMGTLPGRGILVKTGDSTICLGHAVHL